MTSIKQNKIIPILLKKEISSEHQDAETVFFKANSYKIKVTIQFIKSETVESSQVDFYEWTLNGWTHIQNYNITAIAPEYLQKFKKYKELDSKKRKEFLQTELDIKELFDVVLEKSKQMFIDW